MLYATAPKHTHASTGATSMIPTRSHRRSVTRFESISSTRNTH